MIQNPSPLDAAILAELEIANLVNYHTGVPDALFRSYLGSVASVYSIAELKAITTLDLNGNDLDDVTGIEYATSLLTLNLSSNNFISISVEALVNLAALILGASPITEIDIITLVNLTSLNLLACQIAETKLANIVDDLHTNRTVLGGNSCVIDLRSNPGSAAIAVSKSVEIAAIASAGCTLYI